MVLIFNGVYTIFAQPFGRLSDRVGRLTLIMVGWGFYALVYLGFALSTTVWQIGVLWALYGLYYAMTEGALKSLVPDLTPSRQRGPGYGWLNGAIVIMATHDFDTAETLVDDAVCVDRGRVHSIPTGAGTLRERYRRVLQEIA